MKFTQEIADGNHTVTAHSEEAIAIDGTSYKDSLMVLPDEIIQDWPVSRFSDIAIANLEVLNDKAVEIILIGTGTRHHIPDMKIMSYFLQNNVGCEAMTTAAACRTYNLLTHENRRVAACLLLEKT